MRKLIFIVLLCTVFMMGCSGKSAWPGKDAKPELLSTPAAQDTLAPELKLSDYFPLAADVHMKYKGTGNEYAEYETYVDYINEDTMQIRNVNPGTTSAVVYKLKDGILKKVYSQGEIYYKYDYTASTNSDETILKEPIVEGTSWNLSDGSLREITAVEKEIEVPAGKFETVEVTTKRQNSIEKDYYAKNMGLIKREYKSADGSFTVTSELEKFEKGVPYKQKVKFYFPQFTKDRIVYIEREIATVTNEDIKVKLEEGLKTVPENSELTKVLSPNAKILGVSIDEKNSTVTVDISSHFVKEMNAGTSLESMLLESVTNTFGNYFQKSKVILTIDGKPYESGHILMKQGEYMKVTKDNVAEYK